MTNRSNCDACRNNDNRIYLHWKHRSIIIGINSWHLIHNNTGTETAYIQLPSFIHHIEILRRYVYFGTVFWCPSDRLTGDWKYDIQIFYRIEQSFRFRNSSDPFPNTIVVIVSIGGDGGGDSSYVIIGIMWRNQRMMIEDGSISVGINWQMYWFHHWQGLQYKQIIIGLIKHTKNIRVVVDVVYL